MSAKHSIGDRFSRLEIIGVAEKKGNRDCWQCRCDCGKIVNVIGSSLRIGKTRSCGCLHREHSAKLGKSHRRHGMSRSPEWRSWDAMKTRCYNKNAVNYKDYGGRGITVCQEWLVSFEAFLEYMGKKPSTKHSIDRIDNNRGYEPGNVRWATQLEQQNNRRSNRLLTALGETHTVSDWARLKGMTRDQLFARLKCGWETKRALTTAIRQRTKKKLP